jgi:lipoprotein signal peptidase
LLNTTIHPSMMFFNFSSYNCSLKVFNVFDASIHVCFFLLNIQGLALEEVCGLLYFDILDL